MPKKSTTVEYTRKDITDLLFADAEKHLAGPHQGTKGVTFHKQESDQPKQEDVFATVSFEGNIGKRT